MSSTLIRSTVFRFSTLASATSFVANGRGMAVVMGDDARFWVVTVADAQRLVRAGYELP